MIRLGSKALNHGTIAVPLVDNLINKYWDKEMARAVDGVLSAVLSLL